MLFNSAIFILLFLPVTLAGFYLLARRSQVGALAWLAFASVVFYGWGDPMRLVPIILASATFNFLVARLLLYRRARLILIGGVAGNLLYLAYFKYAGLLVETAAAVLHRPLAPVHVTLPIGISFFTFTQIAFLVDTWRRSAREYHPVNYGLFVAFFPHLIAGPIIHHAEVMPQFEDRRIRQWDAGLSAEALRWFTIGLFKKLVVADHVQPVAALVFEASKGSVQIGFVDAWAGAVAYALQLYFDFSGYSDMAIGLALLFGVRFPVNFNSPYQSLSLIEFWRRWHITLSRFLRDYLYIPLGGNRQGPIRRYLNLFVTMVLGGLWHGASWNFAAWGAIHGAGLVCNHLWRSLTTRRLPPVVAWGLTFGFAVFAWVPFRAENWHSAIAIWRGMAGGTWLYRHMPLVANMYWMVNLHALKTLPEKIAAAELTIAALEKVLICFVALAGIFLPNSARIVERLLPHLGVKLALAFGLAFGLMTGFLIFHPPTEFLYFRF